MTKARSNATANAAKGDLTVGNGTNLSGVLAVGSNGDTIVADSSTATGLSYQANWAAGKNKLINGDFKINQRAFTTSTTSGVYTFDRWQGLFTGGTVTYSAQTFTAGAAPVAGYEGTNFIRVVTSGQSAGHFATINQSIEDVRTCAGQTVTVSFWAKAASGTPKMFVLLRQNFGSGGSGSIDQSSAQVTLSTSWVRYTVSISVASISGKTIGTSSCLQTQFVVSDGNGSMGAQNGTFDLWGCQVETGSVATAFQTATGTIQGELAACQRYYWQQGGSLYQGLGPTGYSTSTTGANAFFVLPVEMRTVPTLTWANIVWRQANGTGVAASAIVITGSGLSTNKVIRLEHTLSAVTAGLWGFQEVNGTLAGYLGLSAEL